MNKRKASGLAAIVFACASTAGCAGKVDLSAYEFNGTIGGDKINFHHSNGGPIEHDKNFLEVVCRDGTTFEFEDSYKSDGIVDHVFMTSPEGKLTIFSMEKPSDKYRMEAYQGMFEAYLGRIAAEKGIPAPDYRTK